MKKIIRLTESDLLRIVRNILKEQDDSDDFNFEDEFVNPEEEEDYDEKFIDSLDEPYDEEDEFQNMMKFKEKMRSHKLGSMGIGSSTRWDKDSEKPYSPLRADDLPLEKFLKSKYNRRGINVDESIKKQIHEATDDIEGRKLIINSDGTISIQNSNGGMTKVRVSTKIKGNVYVTDITKDGSDYILVTKMGFEKKISRNIVRQIIQFVDTNKPNAIDTGTLSPKLYLKKV